jgi:hypothetical protein
VLVAILPAWLAPTTTTRRAPATAAPEQAPAATRFEEVA